MTTPIQFQGSAIPKEEAIRMEGLREELRAEYAILQTQYEAFDGRALLIKSWSAPLIGAVVGLGWKENSYALIVAAIVAAMSLWLLEAIWKSFQYCYTDRIKLIEAWFRGERQENVAPFQIFSAWGEVWRRWFKHPKSWLPILRQPFVYLPYLPLVLLGVAAIAYHAVWK
jgi:hypothetical protein